jgi:hypothetical protein
VRRLIFNFKVSFMKKIVFILFAFVSSYSFGQNFPDYENIKLDEKSDIQAADTFALVASTYLLSTPFDKDELNRLKALQFIIKWMAATPDYTFTLEEVAGKIMKGNNDLLGLYMAAMTKYSLENKVASQDEKLVKLNAIILLLNYCENKDNNIKMTKQLKALSEAKAKGELEKALK